MAKSVDTSTVQLLALLASYEALHGQVPSELFAHVMHVLRTKRTFASAEALTAEARLAAHQWVERSEIGQRTENTQLSVAPSPQHAESGSADSEPAKPVQLLQWVKKMGSKLS